MKKYLLLSLMLTFYFSAFCQITNTTKFDLTEKEKTKIVEIYKHCNFSENNFINDLSNDSIGFVKTELDRFIKFPSHISDILKYQYLRLSDFRLFIQFPEYLKIEEIESVLKSAEVPDGTVNHYAVFVGCNDYNNRAGASNLSDCVNDAQNVNNVMTTVYNLNNANIRLRTDETGNNTDDISSIGILSDLDWLAEQADENDVIMFFFAGHGSGSSTSTCKLVTQDGDISQYDLKNKLDLIKAECKIVVMDACHSGGIRSYCEEADNWIVAAAGADENSQDGLFFTTPIGINGGVFTSWFLDALTYYESSGRTFVERLIYIGYPYNQNPDDNLDNIISLREAFEYAKECTENLWLTAILGTFHPEMSPVSGDVKLGKYYEPKPDNVPPYVQNNEQYFPDNPSASMMLFFSETVDATTLNNSNIILQGSKSGVIPFTHNYDASLSQIIIDHSNEFQYGEEITLTLTTGIKDLKGNSLDGDRNGSPGPNYTLKFTVINFPHDYSVSDIELSNTSPVVDEVVSVCATIKNVGQVSEAQGQSFYLYVDDVQKSSSQNISGLAPGQETVRCFNWTATAGVHKLEIKVALAGDENADNNSASTAVFVGTAGNLLVDGAQNPVKAVTLNPGNTGLYTLQLQNTGSADILAGVTKAGAQSSWITLTGGSPVTIPKQKTVSYEYKIVVPSATAPGDYQGSILFSYEGGAKTAAITFNIKVISFVQGTFTDVIDAATYTIDGSNLSTTGLTHYFGSVAFFNLDNDNSTSYPSNLVNPITLSNDQYNRLNQAKWEIYTLDELKGTANVRLSIPEGTGYKTYTSDASLVKLDILNWFVRGSNSVRISLDNFVVGRATDAWDVRSSQQYLSFSKSAWGKDYSVSSNNLNRWQDGWDYGRVYYTVSNVVTGGDLLLFNNGKQVAVSTISTSDNGKTKYFSITSGEIGISNYFNIKGDYIDATKATISNIRLEVNYFDGDPNLKCTKTLSSSTANINENVTVNLLFENIGSNVADEPRYNDSPLPDGLIRVSGDNLSGGTVDLDPNETTTKSYIIKATKAGIYTFGATAVTYQDFSDHNYSTQFNAVTLYVSGGSLLVSGELNKNEIEIGENIVVSAVVTENVSNTPVTDAIVECTITNKTTGIQYDPFYLIYNVNTAKYVSLPFKCTETGDYEVQITAQKQNFTEGNQNPVLTFKVVPIPYLTVEPLNQNVACNAGSINYIVNSNINWDVTENEDWLNAFKLNNTTVQVDYSENSENSIRSGLINIISDELSDRIISLSQENCVVLPSLSVSKTSISLDYISGASGTFNITSNTSWTVTDNASWLDVSLASGSNNGTITVTANSANTGTSPRTAIVTITGTGVTNKTVTITQSGSGTTANLGYTEVYNTVSTGLSRKAMPVTFSESGSINSISIYHDGGAGNVLLGVYSDQSGLPASQLGVTPSTVVNSTAGWQTVSLSNPVAVTSGQKVWLAWVFQNGIATRYTTGTPGRALSSATWSSGLPATFGTSSTAGTKYSIYCTYTKGTPELSVSPASISLVSGSGASGTFNITSNTSWNITGGASWLDISPVSGTNNGTVTVTANSANTGISERTATLTIAGTGVTSKTVTVTQGIETTTANLGYTEVYSTVSTGLSRKAMPVTFSESGSITSISIYHDGGAGNVLLGVYSDQSGLPASQLGVTPSTVVNSTAGWQTVTLSSPVAVTSGQKVWLAWIFQNGIGTRYTTGTPGRALSSATWSSGLPATFGTSSTAGTKYSIYCTYIPGEPTTTVDLGNTAVYSTVSTGLSRKAMPVTFSESGSITSISIYHDGGAGNVLLGVYSDMSGLPSSRLGVTPSTVVNSSGGWQKVTLSSPVSVTSGQTVWLAWVFQNGIGTRYTTGTPGRALSSATWSSGLPATFGTSSTAGTKYSIYCTYTKGPSVDLAVSPTSVSLDYISGASGTFNITSNTSWNITDDASWLNVSPASGTNNGTIIVTANSANTGTSPRTAIVTISGTGITNKTVTVTQSGSGTTANLGYTEVYNTVSTGLSRKAMPVTFSESGSITSISIYHDGGAGNVLLGVYSDQSGLPASQLGVTPSTVVNSTAGWQKVTLSSPVAVSSGQTVWLAWVFQNGIGTRYTTGTPGRALSTATWPSGLPATFGTSSTAGTKYSVYCTYIPGETPTTVDLGNTTVYSSVSTGLSRKAMPVTFSESGSITSISIYHDGGAGNVLLGVYSDMSGLPSSRLGVTPSTVVNSSGGWQKVTLSSPVSVTSGQTVWLAWVFQNGIGTRYTTGTPGRALSSATWSSGLPATFGTSSTAGTKYSIYCTYTTTTYNKSAEIVTAVIPDVESADLKVYPNPFSDKLHFEFVSSESVYARIDLYDMTGRMVKTIFEQPIKGGTMYNTEFKPDAIISGMYIYRMIMGDAVYNGKVLFKRE
jgi:hypothetical protein